MALNLNDKLLTVLKKDLEEILASTKVKYNVFLDHTSVSKLSTLDKKLPIDNKGKFKFKEYVSESSLFDFIYDYLHCLLTDNYEHDIKAPVKMLQDIPEFKDLGTIASEIIDLFNGLPYEYTVTFDLGENLSSHFNESFDISDSMTLVDGKTLNATAYKFDQCSQKKFINTGSSTILTGNVEQSYDNKSTYLQVKVLGFVSHYLNTAPVIKAKDTLKSLLGVLIAENHVVFSSFYSPTPCRQKFFVHQLGYKKFIPISSDFIDSDLSKLIVELKIRDGKSNSSKEHFIHSLNKARLLFSSSSYNERIILASKWLLESHYQNNNLLSFIQATVALEILLGDKAVSDLIGLGELLRNRCAYLVASSHSQRKEVMEDFNKIYTIRSKIVHRGKDSLNNDEHLLFLKLQQITKAVISKEICLLIND